MSNRALTLVRAVWAREPVIAAGVVPLAVTAGLLTQLQASTLTGALTAAGTLAGELGALWAARGKVRPTPAGK